MMNRYGSMRAVVQVVAVAAVAWGLLSAQAAASEGPVVTVDPPDAEAGETISIEGSGFQPHEDLEIQFRGQVIATATGDDHGGFSVDGIVPEPVHGEDRLYVIGSLGSSAEVLYPLGASTTTHAATTAPTTTAPTTTAPTTTVPTTATTTEETTTTTTLPPPPPPEHEDEDVSWWETIPWWEWVLIGGGVVGISEFIRRRRTPKLPR